MLPCDHKSVGILVRRDADILLIERGTPPYGFALPAGHVDHHASFEAAAISELREEVGLIVEAMTLIAEGRRENPCRRGGTWHHWRIYEGSFSGILNPDPRETKAAVWASPIIVQQLAMRTDEYLSRKINDQTWQRNPGLEPVWLEWFRDLKIL